MRQQALRTPARLRGAVSLAVAAMLVVPGAQVADADPPRSPRWRTEVYTCSGFAPQESGCTIETRLGGAFPGEQPTTGTHLACNGEHDTYERDFFGILDLEIRGENRGYDLQRSECWNGGTFYFCPCDYSWGPRERITITVKADGVGPWAAKVRFLRLLVPDRPEDIKAKRTARTASLRFDKPHPNGSEVTGYKTRCKGKRNLELVTNRTKPPIKLTGLDPKSDYVCNTRALSNKGPGFWSKRIRI